MIKSLILLSGGLDSLVSLGLAKEKYNVSMALTFDYGQKSALQEIETSSRICDYYNIEHTVLKLDWLKAITKTALVSENDVPTGEELENLEESAKKVWVPNRNGLFLNIAGSYSDSFGYNYILIGANKEEAATFPDNTQEFILAVNNEFDYSTMVRPKVVAPLINSDKNDIVKKALDAELPLELVRSCYRNPQGHCGKCESCIRLKNALAANGDEKYTKILFG